MSGLSAALDDVQSVMKEACHLSKENKTKTQSLIHRDVKGASSSTQNHREQHAWSSLKSTPVRVCACVHA